MAKLTILAKMERNGQKSQNGHAKNHSALSALFALLTVKVQKMQIVQCKKLHENCENSEKSHFSQCVFYFFMRFLPFLAIFSPFVSLFDPPSVRTPHSLIWRLVCMEYSVQHLFTVHFRSVCSPFSVHLRVSPLLSTSSVHTRWCSKI